MTFSHGPTLIVSPHLDDAIFSLGGGLLAGSFGDVTIVTLFSRSRYRIDTLGDAASVSAERAMEDRVACAAVGSRYVHLDLPDASLRDQYEDEAAYMSSVLSPQADDIWPTSRDVLAPHMGDSRYALALLPLGVGGHIDHRISRDAALEAAPPNLPLAFYQDATYDRPPAQIAALATALNTKNEFILGSGYNHQKMKLIEIYRSQVDDAIRLLLQASWDALGGERVWMSPKA